MPPVFIVSTADHVILAVVALVRTALVIVGATVGAATTTTTKNVKSDSNNALRTLIINYEKDRRQP